MKKTENKKVKTLYVSDLDGTLLRKDATLSEFTVTTIKRLVEEGMAFTFATVRSIQSAKHITNGLHLHLPVITRNGSFLADHETGEILEKAIFSKEDVNLLKELLPLLPYCGFVSSYVDNKMFKTYVSGNHSAGLEDYITKHADDKRMRQTSDLDGLFGTQPGYVTMIDDCKKLMPAYDKLRAYPNWECVFSQDTYSEFYWLEVCPKNSTKAKAILKLKESLGFEKLVVFGDSVNDLSMFEIAEESYAVEDALEELKAAATAVIGSNNADAMAKFLLRKHAEV